VEYTTSRISVVDGSHDREYKVHQHMNEWASRGWRLITVSFRDTGAAHHAPGLMRSPFLEYMFFWEKTSPPQ
jgi:hypothetical protein